MCCGATGVKGHQLPSEVKEGGEEAGLDICAVGYDGLV